MIKYQGPWQGPLIIREQSQSWIVVHRASERHAETWNPALVQALDPRKAYAVPILEWLGRINFHLENERKAAS